MGGRRVWGVALALAAAVTACSDDGAERSRGAITKAGKVSVFDVQVGDCLNPGDDLAAELASISAVPCSKPHTHEVFALPEWQADDVYPGEAELADFANAQCLSSFGRYTGADYLDSKLFFSYLQPSIRSWNEADDRRIVCVVVATGEPVRGSVRTAAAATDPPPDDTGDAQDPQDGKDGQDGKVQRALEHKAESTLEDSVRDKLGAGKAG